MCGRWNWGPPRGVPPREEQPDAAPMEHEGLRKGSRENRTQNCCRSQRSCLVGSMERRREGKSEGEKEKIGEQDEREEEPLSWRRGRETRRVVRHGGCHGVQDFLPFGSADRGCCTGEVGWVGFSLAFFFSLLCFLFLFSFSRAMSVLFSSRACTRVHASVRSLVPTRERERKRGRQGQKTNMPSMCMCSSWCAQGRRNRGREIQKKTNMPSMRLCTRAHLCEREKET